MSTLIFSNHRNLFPLLITEFEFYSSCIVKVWRSSAQLLDNLVWESPTLNLMIKFKIYELCIQNQVWKCHSVFAGTYLCLFKHLCQKYITARLKQNSDSFSLPCATRTHTACCCVLLLCHLLLILNQQNTQCI